jgi:N-acyl-D-aspartate/D-glutamate deacylase
MAPRTSNSSADFDLVIRGGLVVDGTGAPGVHGDVAIVGDRVVAVGDVDGQGREEIDADGHVVAPGFIDSHSHMDAQVFWDDLGKAVCWHGVTTTIMGNCGFTLAPSRPDRRDLTVVNIERAEDIAAASMKEGIDWTWSTFAEYMDAVDGRPKGLNYAAQIGHSALRTWAMGDRAWDDDANEEDMAAMTSELRSALRAGAVGFTTSRSQAHATPDDRPVASRRATWDELATLVEIVGHESDAVFELAHERPPDPEDLRAYHQRLFDLAVSSTAPLVFGLFAPPIATPSVEYIDEIWARGGEAWALTHTRGVSSTQSFLTRLGFDKLPEWQEVRRRPLDEQKVLLRDPEVRRRLVDAAYGGDYGTHTGPEVSKPRFDRMTVFRSPYLRNPTLEDEANRLGVDPVELMIDLALEHDFDVFFLQMLTPQQDDLLIPLLQHPHTAMGFSDSGAHVSQVFDSSIYSHLLAYWVRERQALPIEKAVQMITSRPADIWRLHDRGRLAPGKAADVTIFDPETIAPLMPKVTHDLPAGAVRIEQRATGFAATIVNGRVLTRNGEATDARPGRLLRARPASAA